jgi:hypothetical protein
MKLRLFSTNQDDYKGHFSDPECHRTATLPCHQEVLVFIAAQGYLTNSFCQRTFFALSLAEKGSFSIHKMIAFTNPTGNMPYP